jgi:[protein-PII] uridylyltransferase
MSQKPSESATKIVAKQPSSPDGIKSRFLEDNDATAAIDARSEMVDALVCQAYQASLAAVVPQGIAVLAVGGFGRRELFPHSDIDVLLLIERDLEGNASREALSAFLRSLWDSGLRLSQSVRTISECCELDQKNVELSISLLDQRFLTGDQALYERLNVRLPKFFRSQRQNLIEALCDMTRSRHAKFHGTMYHLEPNIKETPGGMRDLHLVHWMTQLLGVEDESVKFLTGAREFLWNLRCRLHYEAGRDSNVLTFDLQEKMSPEPGAWMRQYYRHARDIHRAALRHMEMGESLTEGSLLKQFRDWRSRLSNAEFSVNRDRIFFKWPQQIQTEPELVLRLFEFAARHGIRLALDTERRISENLPKLREHFARSGPIWPALREILMQPHAAMAIRAMHDNGVLLAIFPEWEAIECLVVRDFYHRYTVDEHTLITLETLQELRDSKDPTKKRFIELYTELDNPAVLMTALLFHDVGKGYGFQGHEAKSRAVAKTAFDRIQMPAQDQELCLFLIEQHLILSALMNTRDLNDPTTARELADRVGTIEQLRCLTLVTYADIGAVNPEAMTPWRLEQLRRAFVVTHRELTRELDTERIETGIDKETAAFLEGFPTRYVRTHKADEIRSHMELEEKSKYSGVAVDLKKHRGTYRLAVVTSDRPNLFASLTGVLSSFGMNILKAEAFANKRGNVLDTFAFSDPMRTLELNPMEIDRLKLILQRAALGKEDVRKLLAGRPRPARKPLQIQPTVAFDSSASKTATLVEVIAEDRPGLLYDLSATISGAGCSIDVVLIDTEAHKALDVFYVSADGHQLAPELQASLKQELLAACTR